MKRHLGLSIVLLTGAALLLPGSATATKPSAALGNRQIEALFLLDHPRGLNRFVRAVSDPASPHYRRYASVEALVKRFEASKANRRKTLSWLTQHGLHGAVGATGTFVVAKLARGRAERMLPLTAAAAASSRSERWRRVPRPLRGVVSAVTLLGSAPAVRNVEPRRIPSLAASSRQGYSSILPHTGTASGCLAGRTGGPTPPAYPFTPNQFLTAYGHAAMHAKGLRGQGQTVAVVEIDGFRHSDIVTYDKCFGVKTPPIRLLKVGMKKPLPPGLETPLDLEMLTVGAPKVDRILVYEGGESSAAIALTAASALGSPGHKPDVISISLGLCEPEFSGLLALRTVYDNIFAVAAGAGISTLVSSGDTGSSGCRTANANAESTAVPVRAVNMPASSPYVTAVGGTNLKLSPRNRIAEEIVWNDKPLQPAAGTGGASVLSPRRPWWQAGVKRYGTGRIVPDIAALADVAPGIAYYCTSTPCIGSPATRPAWSSVGGTSAAAPLMAAGVALANQYAAKRGQAPLGFLNPLLYRLGADGKTRQRAFYDVTTGNNDVGSLLSPEAGGGHPLGCCSARRGYDWASGWGSLKIPGFTKLAAAAAP